MKGYPGMKSNIFVPQVPHEDIARGALMFLVEHGYRIAWDDLKRCYRILEEGISRKDDVIYPTEFHSARDACYRALQMVVKK